jgi:hypothetical protein
MIMAMRSPARDSQMGEWSIVIISLNLFNPGWMTRSASDGALEFKLIRGLYQ